MDRIRNGGSESGRGAHARGARLQGGFAGALVALAAALGLLMGGRAIAALELPGLRILLGLVPPPHVTFGVAWSTAAVWPAQLQETALQHLVGVLVGLVLAVTSVAVLNAIVLLAEAGASRRREAAVRAALGAGPGRLLRLLLGDLRTLFAGALGLGLVLGLTAGGALRATWPGVLAHLGVPSATGGLAAAALVVAGLTALGYVLVGLRVGSGPALARELTSGARVTDEGRAVALRRGLAAFQMAVAGSVLCVTLALARAGGALGPGQESGPSPADSVDGGATGEASAVVPVRAPGEAGTRLWSSLLGRLARIPGLEAESLATPGALSGLGIRDQALAQCGQCVRGEFVLPLVGARPAHHAVGPGFFRAAGVRLAQGREFTPADRAGAPPVAIVNRALAKSSFENGEPLGHQIRIGTDPGAWYTVVGVVDDASALAVGGGGLARDAVYLSALQQPPRHADVVLRGSSDSVRAALSVLDQAGWEPGPVESVAERRSEAAAPLRWVGLVSLGLGLLALVLAMHGMRVTARQVTRRRVRELAIRRVLGASDARVLRHALAGTLKSAAWGAYGSLLGGTLLVALLEKTTAGVTMPRPDVLMGVAALLAVSALTASAAAARDQLRVEPGAVID